MDGREFGIWNFVRRISIKIVFISYQALFYLIRAAGQNDRTDVKHNTRIYLILRLRTRGVLPPFLKSLHSVMFKTQLDQSNIF